MNWFEQRLGFAEQSPEQVRSNLVLSGTTLTSTVNGATLGCGWLDVPSLAELRALDRDLPGVGASRVTEVVGDVRKLHVDSGNAGALFQAASQFNLLEMVSPTVTPERGVGIYSQDPTQGPACAIACGGGTIYRNYYASVRGGVGQTAQRQIDTLADLQAELGPGLWHMRNGYALATEDGLRRIQARLAKADEAEYDRLRGMLRVGVQHQVPVLDTDHPVTQVYASALPVAYGQPPPAQWEPFGRLILEAAYEATLRVARIWQAEPVYLTLLGGGVFGNPDAWIEDAIVRAIERVGGLDVRIVSYGHPHTLVGRVVARCGQPVTGEPTGRTSRTHPLILARVEAPGGPPIGLTFAPGKVQPSALSGPWRRSLEADLRRLRHDFHVDDLVCLVEDHELAALHIDDLPARAAAHGLTFHRLPIPDWHVPPEPGFSALMAQVQEWRATGRHVAFHCKGGLGRAGTAASCALIQAGVPNDRALAQVRAARPGAVEGSQEAFVRGWVPSP